MDARRGLTGPEADKLLRDLFLEAGAEQAPADLEERVLHQLGRASRSVTVREKPIIPRAVWFLMAIGVVALTAYLWRADATAPGTHWVDQLMTRVPEFPLTGVFMSPWVLATCAGAVFLFALDTLLTRVRLSPQLH